MKMYVLMVDDRHLPPTPFIFSDSQRAIEAARKLLAEYLDPEVAASDPALGESEHPEPELFHAKWNHEGDSMWVAECVVDPPNLDFS